MQFYISKVYFREKENKFLLGLDRSFIAKNQLYDDISEIFKYIELHSLDELLGKDLRSERVNCPVRALKYYLDMTKDVKQEKKLLFISFTKGKRTDIHPNTISFWLKSVITACYNTLYLDNKLQTKLNVKAHDVRALASSWAAISGASMKQIMDSCTWKSSNSFITHYLADQTFQCDGWYKISPFIAAQTVVDPKKLKNKSKSKE